jgi:hypothetical protein
MKRLLNYVILLALSAGTLATTSAAQTPNAVNDRRNVIASATFEPSQNGLLRLADGDDHRRDGDRDRDDRRYYGDRNGDRYRSQYYAANPYYYGNGYYATPYRGQVSGWYDRNGYWHAYDRDRDNDRRR